MIKILAHYPCATDASSYYRGIGPLSQLYKIDGSIDVQMTSMIHWSVLKGCDILFLQRPFLNEHIEAIRVAKECNVKVWIDYDDLLTNIPSHNPFLKIVKKENNLSKHEIKENVIKCLKMADKVSVSTDFLKSKLNECIDDCQKIEVINNAHDDYGMPLKNNFYSPKEKIIFWRGSESHKMDLMFYKNELEELATKLYDFKLVFMGHNPKWLFTKHDNVEYIAGTKCIMHYFKTFKELNPMIAIAPLEDIDFNTSKSNIAALEACFNGSLCISSTKERSSTKELILASEWKHASYCVSKDRFVDVVIDAARNVDDDFHKKIKIKHFELLKSEYLLTDINKKRVKLVKELFVKGK